MAGFSLECAQNEYLSRDGDQVDAVVTVKSDRSGTGSVPASPSGSRAEIVIVDVSGSMQGKKIREARQAAVAAVDCLEDGVHFALIAGNHRAWRLYPTDVGVRLAVSSPETRAEARAAVQGLKANGGTAIGTWLDLASGLFVGETGINHAILLTDGQDESESPEDLAAAIDVAHGRFQCDCRGVGTDWSVAELRQVSTALLGTVDIVARPEDLVEDFASLMNRSMARAVGDVRLRVWTPVGASVEFLRQVSPEVVELGDSAVVVDDRVAEFATGAWGDETREYHLRLRMPPAGVGEERLAARVSLMVGDEDAGRALVRAVWTDDASLSTRIDRQVAHYTGQAELAALVQDGLRAVDDGDVDEATSKLGRAVQLAAASGNEVVAQSLARVVDVDDLETGTVRLKTTGRSGRDHEPRRGVDQDLTSPVVSAPVSITPRWSALDPRRTPRRTPRPSPAVSSGSSGGWC